MIDYQREIVASLGGLPRRGNSYEMKRDASVIFSAISDFIAYKRLAAWSFGGTILLLYRRNLSDEVN